MAVEWRPYYSAAAPPHWRRWFEVWRQLVVRYCEATNYKDAPFFHDSERAIAGILAAAAWQAGLIALQEFRATPNDRSEKLACIPDLWVANHGQTMSEIIETKLAEFPGCDKKRIEDRLPEAVRQLSEISDDDFERGTGRTAIVFCTLFTSGDSHVEVFSEVESHRDRIMKLDRDLDLEFDAVVPKRIALRDR